MFNEEEYIPSYVKVIDLQTDDLIETKYGPRRYWSKTPVPGGYKLYTLDPFDETMQGRWSNTVFKGNQLVTRLRPKK